MVCCNEFSVLMVFMLLAVIQTPAYRLSCGLQCCSECCALRSTSGGLIRYSLISCQDNLDCFFSSARLPVLNQPVQFFHKCWCAAAPASPQWRLSCPDSTHPTMGTFCWMANQRAASQGGSGPALSRLSSKSPYFLEVHLLSLKLVDYLNTRVI